jgi:hypothetical protein
MATISVVLDECAYFRNADDAATNDTELMIALRPSLATTAGMMILTSSPAQMEGVVYALHKRHFGPQGDPLTLVVHSDSVGLNPSLKKSVITRAFENDPVGAASEYGGEFRVPVSNYLERSIVEKSVQQGGDATAKAASCCAHCFHGYEWRQRTGQLHVLHWSQTAA